MIPEKQPKKRQETVESVAVKPPVVAVPAARPMIYRVTKEGSYSSKGGAMSKVVKGQIINVNVFGWEAIDRMLGVGIKLEPIS